MLEITLKEYYNRVLGSWIGRVAGDFVGAPVEMMPYLTKKEKYGEITYFPEPVNLDYVNDDEVYEIIALIALEKYGVNLTAKDIAQEWLNLIYREDMVFTAEKFALNNLKAGIWPPDSGLNNNIYYQYIGAQMRADLWGQIAPGCPDIAKEYAIMDGSISHGGVGIEGEVFVAVLLSQAMFEPNIIRNIERALKFIPTEKESHYTQMVLKSINIYEEFPNDYAEARKRLLRNYWQNELMPEVIKSELNFKFETQILLDSALYGIHVLPNIGIIILSLLYGAKDKEDPLGRSICIAAMMGLDTDCNCGNIGAILGAQLGADKIPNKWKDPLQDTFSTYAKDYEKWKITELAQHVVDIGKQVITAKCQNTIKIIED